MSATPGDVRALAQHRRRNSRDDPPPWKGTDLTKEELDAFLGSEPVCIVGVNRSGRAPLLFAMLFDWDGTTLRFTTYADSAKLPFILRDPSITVIVESGDGHRFRGKGAQLQGRADVVMDPAISRSARAEISRRYAPGTVDPFPPHIEKWYARDHVLVRLTPAHVYSWDFAKVR